MPRLPNDDPRVQELVARLIPLYWQYGSVHALSQALSEHGGAVYPNRIHALLAGERGVNEGTFSQVRAAVAAAGTPAPDQTRIERAIASTRTLWPLVVNSDDAVRAVAEHLALPLAVAADLIGRAGFSAQLVNHLAPPADLAAPDWSFQDDAERICLRALNARPGAKIGMVIPTGGGKTRVALRIALKWLAERRNGVVLWVTHQVNLRAQARRELQQLLTDGTPGIPDDAAQLLAEQIDFIMLHKLADRLRELTRPVLVIVDEAHHAAAPTYQAIFTAEFPLPALFLTATPNRTDGLPLGIDEIAYHITYRELARRRVILLPDFEDFPVPDFDWSPKTIADLADRIIERARGDFTKTLVIAPRIDRVVEFYDALRERLNQEAGHPLDIDDIGFIHGSGNSLHVDNEHFLDRFAKKPRAIYVSAQLLLEGFDDPALNAVIITYPSKSLVRLMQAAGRAVRYAANKAKAFVVQARNDALAYHFDQRWLYQEISDRFRPQIYDITYTSKDDLLAKAAELLASHHVNDPARALDQVRAVQPGGTCRLLLTGLPYFGPKEEFESSATWGALIETDANTDEFRWIFNDFCARGAEASHPVDFLRQYAQRFGFGIDYAPGSMWRAYGDVLTAVLSAASEIIGTGASTPVGSSRPFVPNGATTWLKYVTFRYEPVVAPGLAAFLADCYNAEQLTAELTAASGRCALIVKILVPGGPYQGFLFEQTTAALFRSHVSTLRLAVGQVAPQNRTAAYQGALAALPAIPGTPWFFTERLDQFITNEQGLTYDLTGETLNNGRPEEAI